MDPADALCRPQVDLERHPIGLWRSRWAGAFDRLVLVACLQDTTALRKAIRELLADASRPGSPGTVTAEQLARICAVACEDPEKSDRPSTHWTHPERADDDRTAAKVRFPGWFARSPRWPRGRPWAISSP